MELKAIAEQVILVQKDFLGQIQWIYSVFTADRMVCLYMAEDEMSVREHARRSGLPIRKISKVTAVIGPMIDLLY